MFDIHDSDMPDGLIQLSRVVPRALVWLWPRRLAAGKPALFEGDPEMGKSLVTLDLCARLTTGRAFPDGEPGPEPCNVLLLNAEDDVEDVVVPRLDGLGADRARTFFLPLFANGTQNTFPSHLDALERVLKRSDARFAVFDPIKAFLDSGINVNSDHSLRRALDPLFALTARHGCTPLLVNHFNKQEGTRALYRGSGSLAFVIMCRSRLLVAADPHDPGRRILAFAKNNIGPPQAGLAYTITASNGLPQVTWLGPSELVPDQLLACRNGRGRPEHARARARAWLEDFLQDGACLVEKIELAARAQGLSDRTLYRACGELPIESFRIRQPDGVASYWVLRGHPLPDGIPSSAIVWDPAEVLKPIANHEPEAPP